MIRAYKFLMRPTVGQQGALAEMPRDPARSATGLYKNAATPIGTRRRRASSTGSGPRSSRAMVPAAECAAEPAAVLAAATKLRECAAGRNCLLGRCPGGQHNRGMAKAAARGRGRRLQLGCCGARSEEPRCRC